MNIASVFQGVAAFAWIGSFAVVGMTFLRGSRGQPGRGFTPR